jgi:cell division septation protein DedD
MFSRVTVAVCAVVAGAGVIASCTYTKKEDAPIPSLVTNLTASTGPRTTVIGTLPPILPTTTTVASSAAAAPTAPAVPTTIPASSAPAPTATTRAPLPSATDPPPVPATVATTSPRPRATQAPPGTVAADSGPVTVQAGSFSSADLAAQQVSSLAGRGFGGFSVSGGGPFRVVRGGLSGSQANALVRALAGAGVSAFVRS